MKKTRGQKSRATVPLMTDLITGDDVTPFDGIELNVSRVRRSFSVRSKTMQNGSKILFALKGNGGFNMQNEKEVKQNKAK